MLNIYIYICNSNRKSNVSMEKDSQESTGQVAYVDDACMNNDVILTKVGLFPCVRHTHKRITSIQCV